MNPKSKTCTTRPGEREPGQRGAFLAEACCGNEELTHEVESLLAQNSSGDFMERPALEVAASLLDKETVNAENTPDQMAAYSTAFEHFLHILS